MPGRWPAVVLVAVVAVGPAAGQDLTAEQVRDKVRQAVGYDAFQKLKDGVELSGKSEYWGIPGTFRCRLHPDGRYVRTWTGEGDHAVGFDGKTRWRREFSRPAEVLDLGYADLDRFVFGVLAHRWLASDGGFGVALDPNHHRAYRPCLVLSHPDAGAAARLTVDPETWRPRAVEVSGSRTWAVEFEDHREVGGAWVAGRVSLNRYEGGLTFAADRVAAGPPAPNDPFTPPAAKPDATFDPAAPARLEVRRGDNGFLLVRPAIGDRPAPWMLFDTGAKGTCLTPATADQLGLPVFGRLTTRGFAGSAPARFRRTGRLTLGPVTVGGLVGAEFPAAAAEAFRLQIGAEIGGVVGADVLAAVVAEVDHRAGTVALHDPAAYKLPPGAGWHPTRFANGRPCLEGTFEGRHTGLFLLDTGLSAPLVLNASAVRRLRLLDGRATSSVEMVAVGGTAAGRQGTGDEFRVLGRTASQVKTLFMESDIDDPRLLGAFGLAALGPGTVVFDYPNRRVAFIPKP